jgi:hypothetical protein
MHPFSFTRRRHRRLIIIHRALRVSTAEQHQRREDETVSLSLSRPFFDSCRRKLNYAFCNLTQFALSLPLAWLSEQKAN